MAVPAGLDILGNTENAFHGLRLCTKIQQFLLIGADPESSAHARFRKARAGGRRWFSTAKEISGSTGDEQGRYGFGFEGCIGQGQCLSDSEDEREILFPDDAPASGENFQTTELLLVKIEALKPGEDEISANMPVPDADFLRAFRQGGTIIPGMIRHHLVLRGIALPRPDYVPGLESWILRMDEKGYPADPQNSAKDGDLLLFTSDFRENRISCRRPGEKNFFPVSQLPFSLPDIRGLNYQLIPSPLPEQYLGILLVPEPRFIPMDEEGFLMGRNVAEPGLRLDLLIHPRSLKWQPGKEPKDSPDASLGHIGISGEHARVALRGDQLLVQMHKGSTAFYILDSEGKVKHTLSPFRKSEILADPDEGLLMGCYFLKFL
ncbi:MAG: hypothetical protein R2941_15915 [Desulfobacterales bacterium]